MLKQTEIEMENRHGGLYDRGGADSYYGRPRNPHYFVGATYTSEKITDLTAEQIAEYNRGYDDNEANGDKKDWG
jgi:hypothetical protein